MTDTIEDLRAVTDTALQEAHRLLFEASRRVSSTDMDPSDTPAIEAEMSLLGFALDEVTNNIRKRNPGSRRNQLGEAVGEIAYRTSQVEAATKRRDELIRAELADGTSVLDLQDVTGLTRARIYQIRDSRR